MTQDAAARVVDRFYGEIWEGEDPAGAVAALLADDIVFRGLLGPAVVGAAAFLKYVALVRGALADYRCAVIDRVAAPVAEADAARVAARMRFSGRHVGPLFGVDATGREVAWDGAAFFTIRGGRVAELWVLGDVDAVKAQLGAALDATTP